MKTAGIAIDSWKVPVFERHLTEAGYTYTKTPEFLMPGITLLKVKAKFVSELQPIVEAANKECSNEDLDSKD